MDGASKLPPLSKVAPMLLVLGLNKFDLDKLGYRQHCEAAFFGIQVGCYFALTLIEAKIKDSPENPSAPKVHTPAEIVMGSEAKPAKEQTVKQYDLDKYAELRTQQLMGAVILGFIYYYWRPLMPLVLQIVMTPLNLFESPLFQIYIMKQEVKRPFPKPNPFGLPDTNAAAGEAGAGAGAIDHSGKGLPFIRAEFGLTIDDAEGDICRADPLTADAELVNKADLKGKVAVVCRGVVPFIEKARRAAEAGAIALIVVNDEDRPYKCTASGEDDSAVTLPVVCVGQLDGKQLVDGARVQISGVAKGSGVIVLEEDREDSDQGAVAASPAAEPSEEADPSSGGVRKTAAGKKKSAKD